jgi:hypothetical protein
MPLSFLAGIVVSLLTGNRAEAEGFDGVARRMHLGPSA